MSAVQGPRPIGAIAAAVIRAIAIRTVTSHERRAASLEGPERDAALREADNIQTATRHHQTERDERAEAEAA